MAGEDAADRADVLARAVNGVARRQHKQRDQGEGSSAHPSSLLDVRPCIAARRRRDQRPRKAAVRLVRARLCLGAIVFRGIGVNRVAVLVLLALAGCNRVGSLADKPPAYAVAERRTDHQTIECVQRQWEARGAAVSTVATPTGVRVIARSKLYSTRLFATADIDAFIPDRKLAVRTGPRSRRYAVAARVCA
jgi:hypothetical protein